ncbi:hypothetical protein [Actinoplanes palleronii]|uniref:Uncharacterized protein n=1 Tax=Actinoplanes palleronii TaxID=113570 RepID=A0ABQ4BQD4_9ACTN|nr:hypothetical protein [Actinoplanes palleronii]GIE72883.1 hypothetical protein Apa02nite_089910 [Actinoplanes palleronii]
MGSARVGVRDAIIAAGVTAIMVAAGLAARGSPSGSEQLGLALLAVGGLALAARRRAPVAVLVVTGLCAVGYEAAGLAVFATAYLVAVYSAMRAGRRVATAVTSLMVLVALPAAAMVSGRDASARRSPRPAGCSNWPG